MAFASLALSSFLFFYFFYSVLLYPTISQAYELKVYDGDLSCPSSFSCKHFDYPLVFPFTISTYPQCGFFVLNCEGQFPQVQLGKGGTLYEFKGSGPWSPLDTMIVRDRDLEEKLKKRNCDSLNNITLPHHPDIWFTLPLKATFFKCSYNTTFKNNTYEPWYKYNCPAYILYYTKQDVPDYTPVSAPNCSIIELPTKPHGWMENVSDPFSMAISEFVIKFFVPGCLSCFSRKGKCQVRNQRFYCAKKEKRTKSETHSWHRYVSRIILQLAIPCGFILVSFVVFLIWRRKKLRAAVSSYFLSRNTSSDISSRTDPEGGSVLFGVPIFSYAELEEATNNFDPRKELGDGGFGAVYYGKLRDGREVAVKRLYEHNYKRVEQFMNEIEILTRLRHRNLVSLYGCTSRHSRELLLVYEYVPNGTVADHLHCDGRKSNTLNWSIRMNIAIETANALAYLHNTDIIHRDVKTNNILLDSNFCVKVADFGLSRLFPNDVTHVSTAPQGTPGYVDPEYHQCYQLTNKSDVYSFGVVLIELISSMPAVDISRHRHEINLANLAMSRIQRCAVNELVDPWLGFSTDDEVRRMTTAVAELAFRCLQLEKEMRPTMDEVFEALKDIHAGKDSKIKEELDSDSPNDGSTSVMRPPPSPETEEAVLLRNKILLPPSPISVADPWNSSSTSTSNSRGHTGLSS